MENIFVEFLPPWIETGLQPAFYDKESGTALQQTARMYARVNMLIRMFNKLSKNTKTTVEDYINRFNELYTYVHDYFDNLDVQEEINNKLDEMYDNGQLSEIIAEFLKLKGVLGYANVASMKSATELINGSLAETYGFYSKGDGGGAKYIIRTITNQDVVDEETIFALNDPTLVAELVAEDEMNILQFGIIGDGTTDLSTKLNKVLSYRGNDYLKINFNEGETYLAQNNVYLYSNTELNLNGATIKSCHDGDDTDYIEFGNGLRFLNNETSVETAGYGAIENIKIYNGTFDGYQSGVGFFILHGLNIKFHDLIFKDCCVGTHVIDLGGCKNVEIKSCIFDGYLISNSDNNYREVIQTDYASTGGMPYWSGTPSYDNLPSTSVIVDNCKFYKGSGSYYPSAVGSHSRNDTYYINNIIIKNCYFDGTSYSSIRFVCAKDLTIENNEFIVNNGVGIKLQSYNVGMSISNAKILNNKFTVSNTTSTAIQINGNTQDGTVYYCEDIAIIGNTCKGDYNGSDITYDTFFIFIGNTKNSIISDNNVSNCKFFIIKQNSTYFKESSISDNRINYCGHYIVATSTDTSTYMEGSTSLCESNNIWTDANSSFNINNFKLTLTASSDLTADQDSQTYYLMPVDTKSINIGNFVSASSYNFELPQCIRKFKVTAFVNAKCGSNTAYKVFRINVYKGSNNRLVGARKIFVANEEDNVSMSCVVDSGHIQETNDKYRIGVECYLEKTDKILAKFGGTPISYIMIEGC